MVMPSNMLLHDNKQGEHARFAKGRQVMLVYIGQQCVLGGDMYLCVQAYQPALPSPLYKSASVCWKSRDRVGSTRWRYPERTQPLTLETHLALRPNV